MKTKLLFIFLLAFSYVLQAQWSQVGNSQFTSFTNNAAISFNPQNGEPYVIFDDATDGNKPKVMRFDGTSWVAVGAAISSLASANHAIKFNPVTNEPWIAYRRTSDNQMDVYSFDGTTWVARGTNINNAFIDFKMQIAFNGSGDVRVIGKQNGPYRVIQFPGGVLSNSAIEFTNFPTLYDMEDYTHTFATYFTSTYTFLRKYPIVQFANDEFTHFDNQTPPYSLREVEAISGEDLAVARDVGTNPNIVVVNATNPNLAQPNNSANNTGFLEFKKSINDNRYYLMYSDASNNLSFEKYNASSNQWNVVPSPSISTSNSSFFVDMNTNSFNGNMYIAYMDSGRVSVQQYTIAPALSRYYVDSNVSGGNGSGDSWANAMTDLQNALQSAGTTTTEIWVASGTYNPGTSRSETFSVTVNALQIYGSFDGTETSISERNILANSTILSGDLNNDDTGIGYTNTSRNENSYHVMDIIANNVLLDGIQINDGHANGSSTNAYGGAVLVRSSSENLTFRNCEFNQNLGLTGGAIRTFLNVSTSMTFENCTFFNNYSRYGSGLYFLVNNNRTVNLDLTNCLFYQNISVDQSTGARGFTGSSLWARANGSGSNLTTTVNNCTFVNNLDRGTTASSERGTLALSRRTDGSSVHNATINNSIFYFNDQGTSGATGISINPGHTSFPNQTFVNNSISEDSFSNLVFLTNTSNSDPLFTDANNNDFTLQVGSPAIDTGDNSLVPSGINADLLNNARIFNSVVDMGVFEFGSPSLSIAQSFFNESDFKLFPNPTSSILNVEITSGTIDFLEIYNMAGQRLLKTDKQQIDVSAFKNGIYILRIKSNKGESVKRFIKK